MSSTRKNEKIIELTEVCKQIKSKDVRTAEAWCKRMEMPIIQMGKKKVTYRFLVDVELDGKMIHLLKEKYPENWEEFFVYYKNNDTLSYIEASKKETSEEKEECIRSETIPDSDFSRAISKM